MTWKRAGFILCVVSGILLRTLSLEHMEYKEDEEYNYVWSQMIGSSKPWPAWGMPSGVYVPNPGMSVWVFAGLAKLVGAHDPVSLARALGVFAVVGIVLCASLGRFSKNPGNWYWAGALALVNPLQVLYQRKLWPEGFLPYFMALTLWGWWRRSDRWIWPALWGFWGACLGQIHMSGFFIAFAVATTTWVTDARQSKRLVPRWVWAWIFGSALAALPLIPWVQYWLRLPPHPETSQGWGEVLQLKYWVFLITNPWGLHVGNALGLLRGASHFAQLSDFARYPLLDGHSTWVVGFAHLALATLFLSTAMVWLVRTLKYPKTSSDLPREELPLLIGIALIAGVLMTLAPAQIRRYYLMVAFPIDVILLVCWIRSAFPKRSHVVLSVIMGCQLMISAALVAYVRANHGSAQGDYGKGYSDEMRGRQNYGPPDP